MKINRNSWHYKWHAFAYNRLHESWNDFYRNEPKSLCTYFWSFLWWSFAFLVVAALCTGVLCIIPYNLYAWFAWHSHDALVVLRLLVWVVAIMGGAVAIAILATGVFWAWPDKVRFKVEEGTALTGLESFVYFLSTRKQKICPRITYQ